MTQGAQLPRYHRLPSCRGSGGRGGGQQINKCLLKKMAKIWIPQKWVNEYRVSCLIFFRCSVMLICDLFHFASLKLVQIVAHDYIGNEGSRRRKITARKRVTGYNSPSDVVTPLRKWQRCIDVCRLRSFGTTCSVPKCLEFLNRYHVS